MNKKINLRIICTLPKEIIFMILECLGTDFLIQNENSWGVLNPICQRIIRAKSKKIVTQLTPLYNIVFSYFEYAFADSYVKYHTIKGSAILILNNQFIANELFKRYCKDLDIATPHNKSLERVICEFKDRKQDDYLFKNDQKFFETCFLSHLIENLNK